MNKEKIRKILYISFIIIFIISILYVSNYYIVTYIESKEMEKLQAIMETITGQIIQEKNEIINNNTPNNFEKNVLFLNKEKEEKKIQNQDIINLKKLQAINSDIVAWLEIENTNINYPILQSKDNDYYLKKNYKKEYSRNGSIFLDYRYDFKELNSNFLVYGHNNNDGEMFNELLNYNQESFYKTHPTINLITGQGKDVYNIISVFKSQVYNSKDVNKFKYYNYIEFENENDFYMYINNSKRNSLYNIESNPVFGDRVLTLSTCEYSKENGRFVIVAIKSKTEHN